MAGIAGKFIKSFSHALRGIVFLFNSQLNARIELTITGIVIIAGILFKISTSEWLTILLCIAMVLSLEGINTAIEIFADKLHPGFDKKIGNVKDVAAGAVLIASVVAAIIGFIIFVPRLLGLINF
ncbi:MAG: diacylglycerol kinase family protein [Bacteroidales bacterium]|nr:diacylglycerol kinase family protein [Bacteroidales bacterium]